MSTAYLPIEYSSSSANPDDEVAKLRIPPHSVEAEQSVLGGLLLDNSAWDRAGDLLSDSDFYRYEHRHIYAAIGALVERSGGFALPFALLALADLSALLVVARLRGQEELEAAQASPMRR